MLILLNDKQVHLCNKLLCCRNYEHLDHKSDSGLCAREMLRNFRELEHYC